MKLSALGLASPGCPEFSAREINERSWRQNVSRSSLIGYVLTLNSNAQLEMYFGKKRLYCDVAHEVICTNIRLVGNIDEAWVSPVFVLELVLNLAAPPI
ncbi:hypothetical protein MHYP_G00058920 [Metynnis hypsauchen]